MNQQEREFFMFWLINYGTAPLTWYLRPNDFNDAYYAIGVGSLSSFVGEGWVGVSMDKGTSAEYMVHLTDKCIKELEHGAK